MDVEGLKPEGRPKLRYVGNINSNGLVDAADILDRRMAVSRATHWYIRE